MNRTPLPNEGKTPSAYWLSLSSLSRGATQTTFEVTDNLGATQLGKAAPFQPRAVAKPIATQN